MLKVQLLESEWRDFDGTNLSNEVPYWFKMKNGNVVLAIYHSNGYSRGWAEVFLDENNEFILKSNTFYLLKGAKIQDAIVDMPG